MRRLSIAVALSLLGLAPAGALAWQQGYDRDYLSEYRGCDRFNVPEQRLACFDTILKLYKLETGLLDGSPEALMRDDERRRGAGGFAQSQPARRATPAGSSTSTAVASAPSPGPAPSYRGGYAQPSFPEDFTARIVRIWKPSPVSKVHFELDNGSVWRQTSGKWLPLSDDETGPVEIFRGSFGGWRMKLEGRTGLSFVAPVE